MSNKTEGKTSRRRSRATRTLAWILVVLMMGSGVTLLIQWLFSLL